MELEAAGIEIKKIERTRSEVPFTLVGLLEDWEFRRAWYYWMARALNGKGIPETKAEELNSEWFEEVRVAGYSGGTQVKDHLSRWGTIDSYHIDTQEGLNAFAALVRPSE